MIDGPAAISTFYATYTTAVSTGVGQSTQYNSAAKATTALVPFPSCLSVSGELEPVVLKLLTNRPPTPCIADG